MRIRQRPTFQPRHPISHGRLHPPAPARWRSLANFETGTTETVSRRRVGVRRGAWRCAGLAWLCAITLSVVGSSVRAAGPPEPPQPVLDPNLPYYHPLDALEGDLKLAGSNTLSHVAAVWVESFQRFYPEVTTSIEVNGSRAAVQGVAKGSAHIGLLSRTIRADEVEEFRQQFDYSPTVLTPCLERTVIYVHRDNPIRGLTLEQIDAIFSSTILRGAAEPARTWRQVGLDGPWSSRKIVAHGRTKDTGSQVFIQEAVLLKGNYRDDLVTHRSNLDIIQAISEDPQSVGFAGLSYGTPEVRKVPLAVGANQDFVAVDSWQADRGGYPLVRPLQLVVNHDPQTKLRPVEREFIKYVFSRLGQEDVIKAGFQAIPARPARVALDTVGLGVAR